MSPQKRFTEQQWRDREMLRTHWGSFCDADATPEDFTDRMEKAGFIRFRSVTADDLEDPFAAERGIEKNGFIWVLTAAGRRVLAKEPEQP